jgi:SAM-dependent methyltransferase
MERHPTAWRGSQASSRERYLAKFDPAEAALWAGGLAPEDQAAYLADLAGIFRPGMAVLDAGAGTGIFTAVLARLEGLALTALEPAPAMLAVLAARPELAGVEPVAGFCDAASDRDLFPQGRFDAIASRQLANGLYDPLAAFANWHHWLKPGGAVVLIDGSYGRDAWQGKWAEEVDELPLSANQSLALAPYLLEIAGFAIERVGPLAATNARPTTRTPRHLVLARKPG